MLGFLASLVVGSAAGVISFGHSSKRDVALGLALGVIGASVIMAALGLCTFASDAESTEGVLGIGLAGAFGWMFGGGTRAVFSQGTSSSISGETTSGTFRLGWWWPWLLLSPTLVILVFFLYLPAYRTFTLSTKL